ncbi:MAG TPA: hypothetical protein VGM84_08885 [Steroidobacteraceae bacterium]
MKRRDECFGVMYREWIEFWSIGFAQPRTAQATGRILLERSTSISEVKRTPQNADAIVVGLLAPVLAVCEAGAEE